MILEIFKSSNCPFSPRAIKIAKAALSAYDNIALRVIDVRQDRQRAQQMDIYAVPTLVLNDQVIFIGSPTLEELDSTLQEVAKTATH